MDIKKFIGKSVRYDREGQQIYNADDNQLLLDVRGWGAIQNLFADKKGKIDINIYRYMKEEIKQRVIELFKPALERIKEQSNCDHLWKDKDGSAYFRCEKCGFLAQDKALDRLIFTMKLMDKGLTPEMIKKFKDYI